MYTWPCGTHVTCVNDIVTYLLGLKLQLAFREAHQPELRYLIEFAVCYIQIIRPALMCRLCRPVCILHSQCTVATSSSVADMHEAWQVHFGHQQWLYIWHG